MDLLTFFGGILHDYDLSHSLTGVEEYYVFFVQKTWIILPHAT